MGVTALTIEGTTSHGEEVLRRIDTGLKRLVSPSAVVVFVLGRLGKQLDAIAHGFHERHPGLCAVVTETEGLFTERGEIEAKDGFGCLLHSGRPARLTTYRSPFGPFDGDGTVNDAYGYGVVTTDERTTSAPRGPCLHLFSEFPTDLGHNGRLSLNASGLGWFGAVTTTQSPIWTVNTDGKVASATAVRLEFSALKPPLVANAACCRVVSQPLTVTAVSGTTLLELDQMPALVALGQVTAKLPERSWIVIALAPEERTTTELTVDAMPSVVSRAVERESAPIFRPLRGIDPSRGALVLREPLARGTRVAFAVRDDRTAKRALEESLRKTRMLLSGSVPRFGLYFEGLGRGRPLYGTANVELSLLRQTLGEFPILGSRSTLELQEQDGSLVMQAMSGQLALFVSPS
jgi:small ligand-binding sensory domain FIST